MTASQDFQSPTKRAKGLGSAKEGSGHWIAQRVSGILIAPLGLIITIWLSQHHHLPYAEMIEFLSCPWAAAVVFLFVASASYHAALGLQVIIEDYVHSPCWRYGLLLMVRLAGYLLPVFTLFLLIHIMLKGIK